MSEGVTPDVSALQRRVAELEEHNRVLNREAAKRRLQAKEYKAKAEAAASTPAAPAPDVSEELETLRRENRTLRHRGTFDRMAREAGAKSSAKALDTLWNAIEYKADGEADPKELAKRIESVRADYDFLFDGATAEGEKPEAKPSKSETPAKPAGPGGAGRGAPADGTGSVKLRKSDLQSFDPRINPMLDRHAAARIKQAEAEGKLQYIDE